MKFAIFALLFAVIAVYAHAAPQQKPSFAGLPTLTFGSDAVTGGGRGADSGADSGAPRSFDFSGGGRSYDSSTGGGRYF